MNKISIFVGVLILVVMPNILLACLPSGYSDTQFTHTLTGACSFDNTAGTASCTLAHGDKAWFGIKVKNADWTTNVSVSAYAQDSGENIICNSISWNKYCTQSNVIYETAPSQGTGTVNRIDKIITRGISNTANCYERSLLVTLTYGTGYTEYSQKFTSAQTAVQAARSAIDAAQSKITEAQGYGVSTGSYSVSTAQNYLSQAQAKIQSSSSKATGPILYDDAASDADQATALANQAKSAAESVSSSVDSVLRSPLQFGVVSAKSSVSLSNGKSETVTISVQSQDARKMSCSYQGSGGSNSIGTLQPKSSQDFPITITAPSSGTGTQTFSVSVACQMGSYAQGSKTTSISVQYQPDPAETAIKEATDSINTANAQIQSLESAIQGAISENSQLDLFLGSARQYLDKAKTAKSQAEASLSAAKDTYSLGDSNGAVSQGQSAKASANSVNQYVETGKSDVVKAIEDFKTEGGQAQLLIQAAESKISSAESWIGRANSIIDNATTLGMDTKDQTAKVKTAQGLLTNARSFLQTSKNSLSSMNFAQAKNDAGNSEKNAVESETKSKEAYESLSSIMEACKTGFQEMLKAQSEISNSDKTYSRLAEVVKSLPKEIDTTATTADIETQRQSIDKAKNDYSAAQNKISAGYCTQAVDTATQARNEAAEANNQLTRVAERMKNVIEQAIDSNLAQTKTSVELARQSIQESSELYGIDSDKVTTAQEQLMEADTLVKTVETAAQGAKSASSLSVFLEKSAAVFLKMRDVQDKAKLAKDTAEWAKNETLIKFGAGAAAAVGTAGAGFMWWRRRSKGKKGKKDKEKDKKDTPSVQHDSEKGVSTETGKKKKKVAHKQEETVGEKQKKAKGLVKAEKFEEAAQIYESMNKLKEAADLYMKANNFEKAASLYSKLSTKGPTTKKGK